MKHLTIFCIVIIVSMQTIQAQQSINTATDSACQYPYYMKKQNTSKTIGFVCLASGLTVGYTGYVKITLTLRL